MSYPPLQGYAYYNDDGPLQGGVVYQENLFKRILRGVGGVLKDIGGAVIDHGPDILQGVATGLAMTQLERSGNTSSTIRMDDNLWQSPARTHSLPQASPIPTRELPPSKPSTIARDALRRLESQHQPYQPSSYIPHNPLSGMVTQAASRPIHQPHQSSAQPASMDWFNSPAHSSGAFLQAMNPNMGRSAYNPVQEDWTRIQHNLSYAQKPVTQAEINTMRQQQLLAQREAEELQRLAQAQQQRLINTRPLNESPAAQQMIMRSNDARAAISQPSPPPAPPKARDKAYLNRRQEVLNQLFGGSVFDRTEQQFPYDSMNGHKIDDRNIAQMAAVADWILFGQQTNGQWDDAKMMLLEDQLRMNGRDFLPPAVQRQLDIARQLNDILKRNESVGFQRDDAKTLANGMRVLINANTHNGKVNEAQLISDIQLFTIDSAKYEAGRLIGQAKASNAAFNLFAGPRIGTIGWKEKYWDESRQYEADTGRLVNQAHHFTFFFTKGLLAGSDAATEIKKWAAYWIDLPNPPDQELGILAVKLGRKIRTGKLEWKDVPKTIYEELKE
jgi:hypothetical protein